jgi:multiple sugar transport system permease protein
MATIQALAQRRAARPPMSARTRRKTIEFYLFIAPWLLGFVALLIIPLAGGFATSLTNYDGLNLSNLKFLGAGNYVRAFNDPDARYALGRTLLWAGLNVPLWMGLSFGLALILNQDVRGRGFFRTLFYIPTIIPVVPMVWIWKIFLDQNVGLFNAILSIFRPGTAVPWLSQYALVGLTAIAAFSGLGWGMVVFLAGLQDIPDELVEAAQIDGASSWQVFWHITLPLMTPVVFFVLILGVIGSFQQFVLPLLLGSGTQQLRYPPRDAYFFMVHVYQQLFSNQRFGYGTALLWLLFLVILALTLLLFKSQRYWVYTEAGSDEKRP